MKAGIYLHTHRDQAHFVVLLNNYWDCYTSKWEKTKISKTIYLNHEGQRIEQRTSSVEAVFDTMEYLGKL